MAFATTTPVLARSRVVAASSRRAVNDVAPRASVAAAVAESRGATALARTPALSKSMASGASSMEGCRRGHRHLRRRRNALVARAGLVEQLDADGLEACIASRDRPLVIDFFATWCGPCVLMAKELEAVAAELGDKVKIVKVDVDANEAIATSLQIQGLPTLVFVGTEPGKPALRTEGLLPAATIKEIIANEL